MPGSPDNLDDAAAQLIDWEVPQPATHGHVHVPSHHPNRDTVVSQMQAHLAQHVEHLKTTAAYHKGTGVTGQDSQGGFAPGGASAGADYSTTSTGNTGDADSGGPSGL